MQPAQPESFVAAMPRIRFPRLQYPPKLDLCRCIKLCFVFKVRVVFLRCHCLHGGGTLLDVALHNGLINRL